MRLGCGLLALACYAVHGAHHVLLHQPEHALWACHLGSALVGFGLLARSASANAVGLLWLVVGVPLWLGDLATGGPFFVTSLLTHVGGLALGLYGLATLGMPEHAAWKALLAFAALQQATRWVTPAAANVNVAFAVWPGWESRFPSYLRYEAALLAAGLACFTIAERLGRRGTGALQRVRAMRAGSPVI